MAATDDLFFLSIGELAGRIRRGEISSLALTRAMLERIDRLDSGLHGFVRVTPERALADAERAERALASGRTLGPLHGVPIALKDLVDTAGIATEAGTKAMAGRMPTMDATVAARLRDAGAVLLGKLAMAEGAFADHRPERPAPVNPWDGSAWTGVSSSGAGVAVAAGMAFGAIGSDTGGSIRFPCSACGVTGLKPGWGRVSRHGIVAMAPSLDHVGPIARSAADCALLLTIIAGADPHDPTCVTAMVPDLAKPAGLAGLRIGIDPSVLADIHPDVAGALHGAVASLAGEGAMTREISLPDLLPFASGWAVTCGAEVANVHQPWFDAAPEDYGPALSSLIHLGRTLPATDYARLHAARLILTGRIDALFDAVELIAVPVMPMPTPSLAALADAAGHPDMVAAMLRFTAPFNYSGHPSLTLPGGVDAAGLPIGLQLIAPKLGEARLLSAGAAFQQATDWHMRRPPLAEARRPPPAAPSGSRNRLRSCA
jgi:amidase